MLGKAVGSLFAIAISWFGCAIPLAQAATIAPSTSSYCNISFSGPITNGDATKLVSALKDIPPRKARFPGSDQEFEIIAICLNSPGGEFAETLKIVDLLVGEKGNWDTVGTVIDNGAECIGECAFVFMAGKRHEFHGISFPLRNLHIGGKLAFRLPKTAAQSGAATEKELAQAYTAAVKQVRTLMESNAKKDLLDKFLPFPKTLTAKVLVLDNDELMPIDTLEQLGAWSIHPLGLPAGKAIASSISDASLQRACANHSRWYFGTKPKLKDDVSQGAVSLQRIGADRYYATSFKGFGQKSEQFCIIHYFESSVNGPRLDISNYANLKPKKDEYRSSPSSLQEYFNSADPTGDRGSPIWYIFDPSTKLSALTELLK